MVTQAEKYQNILKKQLEETVKPDLTDNQLQALIEYMRQILYVNRQINLTGIVDPNEFIEKHLVDSLSILPFIKDEGQNIIDIGTGGGFPGVPLAIACPKNTFVLLDSTAKKLGVIEEIAKDIGIKNVTFVHARAETASHYPAYRDHFDYAVSRAVAQFKILAELCLPFVKIGGEFIAYKGEPYSQELSSAKNIIGKLGAEVSYVEEYRLPETGASRVLIDIIKKKPTSKKYPRHFSTIKSDSKA